MPPRWAARIDKSSPELVAAVKAFGGKYMAINGVIDGLIEFRGRTFVVDWKSPKDAVNRKKPELTKRQKKLVEEGWTIHFISTREELMTLLFT
jgi:ATP-dependent exoDNAse (exonuclease V) beta subunit